MNREIIGSFFTSCLIHLLLLVTLFTLGQRAARREKMELNITEVAYLTKAEIERISGKIRQIKRHKPEPESLLSFTKQRPKRELGELMEIKDTLKISEPATKLSESKLLQDKAFAGEKSFIPEVPSEVRESLNIQEGQTFASKSLTPTQIAKGGFLEEKLESSEAALPIFEVEEKASDSENLEDALLIPARGTLSIEESSKSSLPLREKTTEGEILTKGHITKGASSGVVTRGTAPLLEISELKTRKLASLQTGNREQQVTSIQRATFQIQGPISAREVIHSVVPSYPRWAIEKGIEPTLTLRFAVLPSGKVKDTIFIIRTSGYSEMDKSAIDALKKWKFKPLPRDSPWREEWGEVTFIFSLK
jgi:TonB family protein